MEPLEFSYKLGLAAELKIGEGVEVHSLEDMPLEFYDSSKNGIEMLKFIGIFQGFNKWEEDGAQTWGRNVSMQFSILSNLEDLDRFHPELICLVYDSQLVARKRYLESILSADILKRIKLVSDSDIPDFEEKPYFLKGLHFAYREAIVYPQEKNTAKLEEEVKKLVSAGREYGLTREEAAFFQSAEKMAQKLRGPDNEGRIIIPSRAMPQNH